MSDFHPGQESLALFELDWVVSDLGSLDQFPLHQVPIVIGVLVIDATEFEYL